MRYVASLFLLAVLIGRAPSTPKVSVSPPSMQEVSDTYGYAQTVRVGSTVWVSGQAGFGPNGIPESVEDQSRLAFENLLLVLNAAGASLDDIVELTTYHTSMNELPAFMAAKNAFIRAPYPAWTAVEVAGLAEPALKVEIKAVAVIGSGGR